MDAARPSCHGELRMFGLTPPPRSPTSRSTGSNEQLDVGLTTQSSAHRIRAHLRVSLGGRTAGFMRRRCRHPTRLGGTCRTWAHLRPRVLCCGLVPRSAGLTGHSPGFWPSLPVGDPAPAGIGTNPGWPDRLCRFSIRPRRTDHWQLASPHNHLPPSTRRTRDGGRARQRGLADQQPAAGVASTTAQAADPACRRSLC
jgi:hypothetical protein